MVILEADEQLETRQCFMLNLVQLMLNSMLIISTPSNPSYPSRFLSTWSGSESRGAATRAANLGQRGGEWRRQRPIQPRFGLLSPFDLHQTGRMFVMCSWRCGRVCEAMLLCCWKVELHLYVFHHSFFIYTFTSICTNMIFDDICVYILGSLASTRQSLSGCRNYAKVEERCGREMSIGQICSRSSPRELQACGLLLLIEPYFSSRTLRVEPRPRDCNLKLQAVPKNSHHDPHDPCEPSGLLYS